MTTQAKIEDEIKIRTKQELLVWDKGKEKNKNYQIDYSDCPEELVDKAIELATNLGITEGKKLMIDEVLKIVEEFNDYPEELGNYLMPKLRELQKLNNLKEQK